MLPLPSACTSGNYLQLSAPRSPSAALFALNAVGVLESKVAFRPSQSEQAGEEREPVVSRWSCKLVNQILFVSDVPCQQICHEQYRKLRPRARLLTVWCRSVFLSDQDSESAYVFKGVKLRKAS